MPPTTDTREALILAAIEAIETVGFPAMSFRDLADTIGIKSASIHYHFPSKADLGLAVIHHLEQQALGMFAELEREHADVAARFRAKVSYTKAFAANHDRMCAWGSMLSDYGALPDPVRIELTRVGTWVHQTYVRWIDEGRRSGQLYFPGDPGAMAGMLHCVFIGVLMQRRAGLGLDADAVLDQALRLMGAAL